MRVCETCYNVGLHEAAKDLPSGTLPDKKQKMNNLCCLLDPEFYCDACNMTVCHQCYINSTDLKHNKQGVYGYIFYHEKESRCPKGANAWSSTSEITVHYYIKSLCKI